MVPGSTLRYGSSFCIVTRSPRAFSRRPRLEAVRPLPRLEATPPVTKTWRTAVSGALLERANYGSRGVSVRQHDRRPLLHPSARSTGVHGNTRPGGCARCHPFGVARGSGAMIVDKSLGGGEVEVVLQHEINHL